MGIADLPAVNASLNALAAVLLTTGYILIRRGKRTSHKRVMLMALVTSSVFLASYVVYHIGIGGSRPFTGQGPVRVV